MGLKSKLSYQQNLEILFRLKLEALQNIINDSHFHKEITDIKTLVSDLLEIAVNYESKTLREIAS
ncbi:hypothetical protein Cva_00264 [Caedimonas varicaedens]|jgi:hypothetical protein|uniref:Uncharacterized protein n=1 Tax=Caedimonas varicaedens TaxID=1629334 RepID=A0A0K8MBP6_9PROT|nr:hypothetical protein Cva_00264 [Caedimonas varicaedens]